MIRVLYDAVQALLEDQGQMDSVDVCDQAVAIMREMDAWLSSDGFPLQDMDLVNDKVLPALGQVELDGPALALLQGLRTDFCDMMNVRARRDGSLAAQPTDTSWAAFLKGCHVDVDEVCIDCLPNRTPRILLTLTVKQQPIQDLQGPPHDLGAAQALQAFSLGAQKLWTLDQSDQRAATVKNWVSMDFLPALEGALRGSHSQVVSDGVTMGLAREGSAQITRLKVWNAPSRVPPQHTPGASSCTTPAEACICPLTTRFLCAGVRGGCDLAGGRARAEGNGQGCGGGGDRYSPRGVPARNRHPYGDEVQPGD